MRAIVTRKNNDGTFDNVGTDNRFVTKKYKTKRTLIQYGIPDSWLENGCRVEWYNNNNIYKLPDEITYF